MNSGSTDPTFQELLMRVDAAEKTVAVLKNKVIDLYNSENQSIVHKQLDRAKRRDEENRRKQELAEVRNQELKKYSETLEAEVAKRTEDIRVILNNVTFGFVVVDNHLTVGDEYSRSCVELFGRDNIAGKNFLDLFGLGSREKEHFQLCLDQVFEDILPSHITLDQIPHRFVVRGRVLHVEGREIRGKKGEISGILFTVSDNTALEEAQLEATVNRILVNVLKQRDAFQMFLMDVRELMIKAREALATGDEKALRRILHTVKGNAGSYELQEIVHCIHKLEEEIVIEQVHLNTVEDTLRKFLAAHKEVLDLEYDSTNRDAFEISENQIDQLKKIVASVPGEKGLDLRRWTAEVVQKPASVFLGPVSDFVGKLADRLGKRVEFVLEGGETLVDSETVRGVFQNIVHLIRNSVDHGIEPPSQRKGKPSIAQIKMKIARQGENYVVSLSDDGRGIDVPKLMGRALQKGFVTQEKLNSLSPAEQLNLIYIDGLSSADETTEISGRGIGMSAIREVVKKARGSIQVSSSPGKGTEVVISLPMPESFLGDAGVKTNTRAA